MVMVIVIVAVITVMAMVRVIESKIRGSDSSKGRRKRFG